MNVKKTIASIAAIAMVASATSLAPLFTGTSISADELTDVAADDITPADGETDGVVTLTEEGDEPEPAPAAPSNGLTAGSSATVDTSTITGTGSASVTTDEKADEINVRVTLTPTDGDIGGQPQNGSDASKKNYHITIPISGLGSEWELTTDRGGQYTFDSENKDWNVASGNLMLWLPAKDGTCKVVLKKGTDDDAVYQVINVTTTVAATSTGDTLTVGTSATVDPATVKNGTAAAVVTAAAGATPATVTVTLTSEAGKTIGGEPQQGGTAASTPQNYHITIPVTGLDTEWVFESGYAFDEDNHEFNITGGKLMLWLPATNKEHTIVLKKGAAAADAETLTIKVKTVVVNTPAEEEPNPPVVDPVGPTDEEKVDAAIDGVNNVISTDSYTWVNVSDLEVWAANSIVDDLKTKVADRFGVEAEMTLDGYSVDDNGLVTMFIKVKVGDAVDIVPVEVQCTDDRVPAPVVPDTPAPAPVISYYPPVVSNNPVNPSAGTVKEATSAVEISAAKQKEVTVNATEADVTPTMVQAFIKNKNTKTLTLKYSSALKISIDKANITSTSANLDFSVSGKNFISSKTINKSKFLKNASKIVQLDFVNKGDLDGVDKVSIKSKVGMEFVSKTVTVYEYKNGKLIKVAKVKVNGAGIAKFDTDHLGQFVLAVE